MKIAVTGTSGRIGRAIHFALCREHEAVGIDRAVSSVTTHLGEIDDFKVRGSDIDSIDTNVEEI